MSVDFEWVGVEDCPINVVRSGYNLRFGEYETDEEIIGVDDDMTSTVAIVVGGENGVVVTADYPEQLVEFARTLLRMTEEFSANPAKVGES